ncbi:hypothetical protein BUY49_10925 [Staphylococcus devriesei]|uniref:SIR2 family protein n=1 Tax=Staphylococcus devriesei TaxID=586733 RepID=UPI000E689E27|nr:SIR2 family protein [Staphylococcus devriesei]RIL69655.1 hypothetical protein BUY49_10925 [Staphylococcus devriesei]
MGNLYHIRGNEDINANMSFKEQEKEIKKFIQKQLNNKNLNFLIGSGCSLPGVGLMGETFMKLKETVLEGKELGQYNGKNKDIEGYLNWLNTALLFFKDNQDRKKYEEAFTIAKKGLIDSIQKSNINENEEKNEETIKNYKEFYSNIFSFRGTKDLSPLNIFTTNYDLYNEIALEKLGIYYTNGFIGNISRQFNPSTFRLRIVDDENRYKDKWSIVRKYVKLYKIHGSIDWVYDKDNNCISQVDINSELKETKNVMIYPTTNKHMETQQSPYSELFREFTNNLQKRNCTLIVMGYGFPDEHINQIISQGLNNDDFNLIIFANKEEDNIKNFLDKHRYKKNLHIIGGNYNEENDGHHFHVINKYFKLGESNDTRK